MLFPSKGVSFATVERRLKEFEKESLMTAEGKRRLFIGLYRLEGLPEIREVTQRTLLRFMESIPSGENEAGVRKMEGELISMMGSLWGKEDVTGFMTTGGTESNIVALQVAKTGAKAKKGSVVFPSTAYAYFLKACLLLDLEPISVPVKDDFTPDVEMMRNAVRKDTVAIAATAGTNPWGNIDPIREIGKIAEENSLYFHVDAAYAGLLCPFLKAAGREIPDFGFEIPSVASVSADPHKTGFSIYPGGAIAFREEELTRMASWKIRTESYDDLGLGIIGTRPGFPIAVAWALFNYLGMNGYAHLAEKCMEITWRFMDGVKKIPNLEVASRPTINIGHFASTSISIEGIRKGLRRKGWFFCDHRGQKKTLDDAIWLVIYPYQEKLIGPFLEDLESVATSRTRS
jgi:glutamate/tyrosine decarboxylase-like PLP-dependent enzyme